MEYVWNASGFLVKVVRPDKDEVTFTYDPLGRRVSKTYKGKTTKWVWDGNVMLHEWCEGNTEDEKAGSDAQNSQYGGYYNQFMQHQLSGRPANGPPKQGTASSPVTWLFEPDSFTPLARLVGDSYLNIITDHLGTPLAMFDEQGNNTWAMELDIYGQVKNVKGRRENCPFRYPGQYEDSETGLYYNRFRYYDPEVGGYVSQDPIGLLGGNPTIYGYVEDVNNNVDMFGLACKPKFNPEKKFNYREGGFMSVFRHILQRHKLSSLYSDVSRFLTNSPKQIQKLVKEGVKTGVVDETTRSITKTFSKNVGTDRSGNLTKTLVIFFDEKGWVRTAFPL